MSLRLGCIAATAAVSLAWSEAAPVFLAAIYSIGFAHYLLALRYSAGQLQQVSEAPAQWLSLAGLALLGVALYQSNVPLLLYFGVHHALNEAYGRRAGADAATLAGLSAPAALFHGLAYLTVIRWTPELVGVDPAWLWVGLAAAAGLLVRSVLRRRPELRSAPLREVCAPEIAAAALVVLSLFVRLTFLQVVLYHFLLWAVLPVQRIRQRRASALAEYVGLSAVIIAACLLLSPIGPASIRLRAHAFTEQFLFWSYMHITLSFALSDAHPAWVVRVFRGVGTGVRLPTIPSRRPTTAL